MKASSGHDPLDAEAAGQGSVTFTKQALNDYPFCIGGGPPKRPASLVTTYRQLLTKETLVAAGRGSLVDFLLARRRRRGAYGEVAAVTDLDITIRSVLQDARVVHGVAGIGDALYPLARIRVIPPAGDCESLAGVSALYILLVCLANPPPLSLLLLSLLLWCLC